MSINKLRFLILSAGIVTSVSISGCKLDQLNKSSTQINLGNDIADSLNVTERNSASAQTTSQSKTDETTTEGYFVSPQGSDDNPGDINRPFKTIQKCADLVKPGSTCWLRKGTYRETVIPKVSGTSTQPVTFAAYKQEQVTISGTELVTDWSQHRDSIYRAEVNLPVDGYSDTGFFANQVFIRDEMMPEARVPNLNSQRDFFRPNMFGGGLESLGDGIAQIKNDEIPKLANGWTGGKVWTNEWYTTRTGEIIEDTGDKLLAEMTAEWERGGYWFYLFGKLELLDDQGEWFYDGSESNLYFWSTNDKMPTAVEVKQRNLAFDLSDLSHITIRNINLFANTITTSDRSTGVLIDGIRAKYVSHHMTLPPIPESEKAYESDDALFLAAHAHDTGIQLRGSNNIIKNSVIDWSSGNGVLLEGNDHQVTNNIIVNTNYKVSYAAPVRLNGNDHKISHNTIKRTGRDAISWDWHTAGTDGRNIEIAYNDISEFGMLSTDLGAIYVCCHVNLEGGSIHHNWIRDAQAFSPFWGTRGIYLDIETFNSTIHHNVIWNLTGGKDNYSVVAGSPRGYDRIFNNTFLGEVELVGEYIEARNNIFAASESFVTDQQSNNLFIDSEIKFTRPPSNKSQSKLFSSIPDFTPQQDSSAVDAGIEIPLIKTDFAGKYPDIGAYERNAPPWKAGANFKYNLERN
ncbi:MAG: right-handed parallel beta-helix repeat-containing protein [Cyanobacteria bacterium P01_G01_bin.39]